MRCCGRPERWAVDVPCRSSALSCAAVGAARGRVGGHAGDGPRHGGTGPLPAGTAALVVAFLWRTYAGCPFRRCAESVNLAVMTLLTAAVAAEGQGHHAGEALDAAAVGFTPWPVLFALACWVLARAGAGLVRWLGRPGSPPRPP